MLYRFGMSRALLLGFVVLTAAACGEKTFESLCANQAPPPEACQTACNPAPGATTSCPSGFHCAASGKCDTQCTATGGQCGDGYSCSSDGYCVSKPSGGGGGDDQPQIDADCPSVMLTGTKTTPSIQLLIDRSGSMREAFGSSSSKYKAVHDALVGGNGLQGAVATLQGSVYFGATLYSDDRQVGQPCPALKTVPAGRALNNLDPIKGLIEANDPPVDMARTPTFRSIDAVVADFAAHPAPTGSPPIILLATDGLPNDCNSDTETKTQSVTSTKAAYAAGIKLYILSVGTIKDAATHLQEMANAGLGVQAGQPDAKVFIGTNPAELATAFDQIIGGVLSCDMRLSKQINPDNAQFGDVTLNGEHLTYGDEWTVDSDNITLHLLGGACTTLKKSANPTLEALFPCGTVIP
jgi:hypothetical protein